MYKYSDSEIFRCLLLDLRVKTRTRNWYDVTTMGSLKNDMLKVVEVLHQPFSHHLFTEMKLRFWSQLDSIFSFPYGIDEIIEQPSCFRDVYQILTFCLKIKSEPTIQQTNSYVTKIQEIEVENRHYRCDRSNPITRFARSLIGSITRTGSLDASNPAFRPRHGPGAVIDGVRNSDKNYFLPSTRQLHSVFKFEDFFANANLFSEITAHYYQSYWLTEARLPRFNRARLALVPKDYRGPRGVYISSKEAIYCQLGQDAILRDMVNHSFFKNVWDPSSQIPSQEFAYMGSYNRGYSTLDLADASDRVTLELIKHLFHRKDYVAMAATRPVFLDLPSGESMKLAMFAPMGDGKTFPVLSLVVGCLSLAAIAVSNGLHPTRYHIDDIRSLTRHLRVFGDDIAVTSEYYDDVVAALSSHGLKVNVGKSFRYGYFRESCGVDAYKGVDVTPFRLKVSMSTSSFDDLPAILDLHNRLKVTSLSRFPNTIAYLAYKASSFGNIAYSNDTVSQPYCLYSNTPLHDNIKRGFKLRVSKSYALCVSTLVPMCIHDECTSSDQRFDLNYWLSTRASQRDDSYDTWYELFLKKKSSVPYSWEMARKINSDLSAMSLGTIRHPKILWRSSLVRV